jgi:hypothetical protein
VRTATAGGDGVRYITLGIDAPSLQTKNDREVAKSAKEAAKRIKQPPWHVAGYIVNGPRQRRLRLWFIRCLGSDAAIWILRFRFNVIPPILLAPPFRRSPVAQIHFSPPNVKVYSADTV